MRKRIGLADRLATDGFLDRQPTTREVAEHYGVTVGSAYRALYAMRNRGEARREGNSRNATWVKVSPHWALTQELTPIANLPKVFGERCYRW